MSKLKIAIEAVRQSGLKIDSSELENFLAGVAAAPEKLLGCDWIELIAPHASSSLKSVLVSARDELVARIETDFSRRPPPKARLADLRERLRDSGFDGFVIPRADAFMGEAVPIHSERLRWLTGFSGSAGVAVVMTHKAAIFVDGRYTLQIRNQVDRSIYDIFNISEMSPWTWAANNLRKGSRLAFDPWLITDTTQNNYQRKLTEVGAEFVAVEKNPIDAIWANQPAAPLAAVTTHDIRFAGKSSREKRRSISSKLLKENMDAALITQPDSIAWILNIRGGDVPYAPLALSFLVIFANEDVYWFIDKRKLLPSVEETLGKEIIIDDIGHIGPFLQKIGPKLETIGVDKNVAPTYLVSVLQNSGVRLINGSDPCLLPKARKNKTEMNGSRAAHIRDGVAMVKFLAWLDKMAPRGEVSEISASEHLKACRSRCDLIRDLSFRTISGAGANAAIVHYDVTSQTNKLLEPGDLYLIDSGAQYLDGTTDVTRTVYIEGSNGGRPSNEEIDCFTRVLKGHIAVASAEFPVGTRGSQLDVLGRLPLWKAGLDYDHGTGHGVGSYLCVHEGPHGISKVSGGIPLEAGMIISNEPGFYKASEFGVRIENLVLVCERNESRSGVGAWLGFDTLTCVPIDTRLVKRSMLTSSEIEWLDNYHNSVRQLIEPLVDLETAKWLKTATRPLRS